MKFSPFSQASPRERLIALNAVSGLAPITAFHLTQKPDWVAILAAKSVQEAAAFLGISEKAVCNLRAFPASDFARAEESRAEAQGARIITFLDEGYPPQLKTIADPPLVLYVKGRLPPPDAAVVAIVGARQATSYGLNVAEQFAMRLAESGIVVISGLARGIDAAAHHGALKGKGWTMGVLGCGLDRVYPQQNQDLFRKITETGAVISEFPFGTPPLTYNFPRRNRIVSAWSYGVVVVEANARSGALITAEFAMEQGREVMAVPGRIDIPQARGPLELIRNGARMVLSADDVLAEMRFEQPEGKGLNEGKDRTEGDLFQAESLSEDEQKLVNIIREETLSFDMLAHKAGLPLPVLLSLCVGLQLRGIIKEHPGKVFALA